MIAGISLLAALISLISAVLLPGGIDGWLSTLLNNWLVVIFALLAGFSGAQIDGLRDLNLLDITILELVGVMSLGLYAALKRTSKTWCLIALAQPFLGIVLFIVTKTAGRSTVMGAGLVFSSVMLRSNLFNKATACIGILASVLLFMGDFIL